MKLFQAVLVTAMAISLAGCVLSGKPKTAPPPTTPQPSPAQPEPISIPQTQVNLPAFQAVDPAALKTAPQEEPAPPVETKPAAAAPKPQHPAAPAPTPPPAKPPEQAQPQPQPETSRQPIQEVLKDEERKHLQDLWQQHLASASRLLGAAGNRHLTSKEKRAVVDINQLIKQSQLAETNGDVRLASQLAERADTLAKDLQGGK